jgi:hypothetical protein
MGHAKITCIRAKRKLVYANQIQLATILKLGVSGDSGGGAQYGIDRGAYPQARSFIIGLNVGF